MKEYCTLVTSDISLANVWHEIRFSRGSVPPELDFRTESHLHELQKQGWTVFDALCLDKLSAGRDFILFAFVLEREIPEQFP